MSGLTSHVSTGAYSLANALLSSEVFTALTRQLRTRNQVPSGPPTLPSSDELKVNPSSSSLPGSAELSAVMPTSSTLLSRNRSNSDDWEVIDRSFAPPEQLDIGGECRYALSELDFAAFLDSFPFAPFIRSYFVPDAFTSAPPPPLHLRRTRAFAVCKLLLSFLSRALQSLGGFPQFARHISRTMTFIVWAAVLNAPFLNSKPPIDPLTGNASTDLLGAAATASIMKSPGASFGELCLPLLLDPELQRELDWMVCSSYSSLPFLYTYSSIERV